MLEYGLLQFRPSRIAGAAVLLALLYAGDASCARQVGAGAGGQSAMRRAMGCQHWPARSGAAAASAHISADPSHCRCALASCRSHLPVVAGSSVEDLKPCMRRLLALQRAAHDATDYMSPYLAGALLWLCAVRVCRRYAL